MDDSRFIHTGKEVDKASQSVVPPVYRATTYHQADPWNPPRFDYARSGNPTREALEEAMAGLEHGARGFAFASGMAALTAAFLLFSAGDHLIVTRDCQGGTQRVLRGIFSRFGLEVSYCDTDDLDALKATLRPNTKAILVENFSNPFLRVTDIGLVSEWAHQHQLLVMVDNTFITPYLQQPLDLGADLVIHSATKMISGHSDVTAGVAVARQADLGQRLYFIQNATGIALPPEDSYWAFRGLKTLPVRMERAESSAQKLAEALDALPEVTRVYYPGLPAHPGHETAVRTVRGFGQMLTFRLENPAWVRAMIPHLKFTMVGAGFGGTETIVSLPEKHCHAALTPDERTDRFITPDVVRVSVGLEDAKDIVEEFVTAIQAAARD
ncbi:trans-sulfuration enzyme family protein [Sulfobacillus harzensis]|uniref:Methionine biosynthesis PLP-dependent protein n=1 Tax=Sulfobacillus harzensis TaxID=2729629 RepID=A0A7Y0Q3B9_9FIRM|nr:PLP-dependent transferase [Sulfobacillus harzensis]NMP24078.1 methionine biosynthesis PLP-dependent protein [Sulfobacillus harzensis]